VHLCGFGAGFTRGGSLRSMVSTTFDLEEADPSPGGRSGPCLYSRHSVG
jgi:hypothetical protein